MISSVCSIAVIPAKAGTQLVRSNAKFFKSANDFWIPAFAGMTVNDMVQG
jgi:hypothetical protein